MKHVVLAVSYRAEMLEQEMKQQETKVSFLITLGAHAQRGYCSWVCLSVTLNLTSRVFVRLTKDTTYLTGNEGQNF